MDRWDDAPPSGVAREEERSRAPVFPLLALAAILAVSAAWWALALWPVRGATPEWLARTRAACFGIYDDGLPDTGGWVGLIGSPLGMLAVLFAGWRREVVDGLRSLRRSRGGRSVLGTTGLAFCIGIVAAGVRVHGALRAADLPAAAVAPADLPRLDRTAPPLELVDQTGAVVTLDRFRGRPVLLTFAYAHCETVCPVLVHEVLAAQSELREADPERAPVALFVTLDPWRDTPSRLPAIAEAWGMGEDAHFLGGEVAHVEATLDAWGVGRSRDTRTGDVTHPALVYVLDRDGRIAFAVSGGLAPLVALVRRL
ncbi:MAG TPA: SCO family protein [Longimicrobiales bacterium]